MNTRRTVGPIDEHQAECAAILALHRREHPESGERCVRCCMWADLAGMLGAQA